MSEGCFWRSWQHLERLGSTLESKWCLSERQDAAKMAQDAPQEPNLSEHGAKLAPRWSYVGQLGAQDDQLGSIWRGILAPLKHLGTTFLKNDEISKNFKKT